MRSLLERFRKAIVVPSHDAPPTADINLDAPANVEDSEVDLIAASAGESMQPYVAWLVQYSSLRPKNVVEIGANLAQDAEYLRKGFGLAPSDIWVFEPHPDLFAHIARTYEFHAHPIAVSNYDGHVSMNMIDLTKNSNSGVSSTRTHQSVAEDQFKQVDVEITRMDTFMQNQPLKEIDFLKIDVEGCTYEVLEGFGDRLSHVKSLHIEGGHKENWHGERLWADIVSLVAPHFDMVHFQRYLSQSDSFWLRPEYFGHDA